MTRNPARVASAFRSVQKRSWGDVGVLGALAAAALVGVISAGGTASEVSWSKAGVPLGLLAIAVITMLSATRRQQARRLRGAIAALESMAAGQLPTYVGTSGSGDARRILVAVNRIAEQLRRTLSTVQRTAAEISAQADQMNEVAWAMLNTCEGAVKQAAEASSAADNVSQQMHVIASATEEMALTIRDVARNAADASSIATAGSQQVANASQTVSELHTSSTRVEEIVHLISTIAGQTHMLALNAAIEAARAGEHGRGFGVVADEVKELARQTEIATERVTHSVDVIRTGSGHVADAMELVTSTINRVTDNQQAIAASVEEQTVATSSIGGSTSQAAALANSLAANVSALTHAVRTTAYSGSSARVAAAALVNARNAMQEVVGVYTFEPFEDQSMPAPRSSGVSRDRGVTTIEDFVMGSGVGQWEYVGRWGHAAGAIEGDGTNAHSCMPSDTATIRFTGSRIRFYGVGAPDHGRASVSIDGESATVVDMYDEERVVRKLYFDSGLLDDCEHTLVVTVLGEADDRSRFVWINVDAVEIED